MDPVTDETWEHREFRRLWVDLIECECLDASDDEDDSLWPKQHQLTILPQLSCELLWNRGFYDRFIFVCSLLHVVGRRRRIKTESARYLDTLYAVEYRIRRRQETTERQEADTEGQKALRNWPQTCFWVQFFVIVIKRYTFKLLDSGETPCIQPPPLMGHVFKIRNQGIKILIFC